MIKYVAIIFSLLCTPLVATNISKPANERVQQECYDLVNQAQSILHNSQSKNDEVINEILSSFIKEMKNSLKNEGDWALIFNLGTQLMIPLCTDDLSFRVKNLTRQELKVDKESMNEIYKCFWKGYNKCGGQLTVYDSVGDDGEDIFVRLCSLKIPKIDLFKDMGENEIDDRHYKDYRQFLMKRKERLYIQAMEEKLLGDCRLSCCPTFAGKDLLKALSAGCISTFLSSDVRTKSLIIISNLMVTITEKVIDRVYFEFEEMETIRSHYEMAAIYSREADIIEEWMLNH